METLARNGLNIIKWRKKSDTEFFLLHWDLSQRGQTKICIIMSFCWWCLEHF